MEAIVLAGGFGTRLREIVSDVPKPMAPIAGTPFLEILLQSLAKKGFERIVLSLGYMAEKISNHFGDEFAGMQIAYAIEDNPLGTGGAIRLAMEHCLADHFFVFNGDTFLDLEVHAVEAIWKEKKIPIIVGREVDDTSRYGRLIVASEMVRGFSEKGLSGRGIINAGCYILPRYILDSWPVNTPFSLESDYLAHAVTSESIAFYETKGTFIDIGVPEDFFRAQKILANI